MKGVPKEKSPAEGLNICRETIDELRQIRGVHGVHIMAIENEAKVGEIVEAARLLPRPEFVLSGGLYA